MQKTLDEAQKDFLSCTTDLMREMHMKTKQMQFINEEQQKICATLQRIESKIDIIQSRTVDIQEVKTKTFQHDEELY